LRLYLGPAAVVSAGDRTPLAPIREGERPRRNRSIFSNPERITRLRWQSPHLQWRHIGIRDAQ